MDITKQIESPRIPKGSERILESTRKLLERLERQEDIVRLDVYAINAGVRTVYFDAETGQIVALDSTNLHSGHYKPTGGDPGKVFCAATAKFEDVIIPEEHTCCKCAGCGDTINSLWTGVEG